MSWVQDSASSSLVVGIFAEIDFVRITLGAAIPSHSVLAFASFSSSSLIFSSARFHFPFCCVWARIPNRAPPVAAKSSSSVYSSFRFLVFLDFFFLPFSPPSSLSDDPSLPRLLRLEDFFLGFFFFLFFSASLASVFPTEDFHHWSPVTTGSSPMAAAEAPSASSSLRLVTRMCSARPSRFFPSPVPSVQPIFSSCLRAKSLGPVATDSFRLAPILDLCLRPHSCSREADVSFELMVVGVDCLFVCVYMFVCLCEIRQRLGTLCDVCKQAISLRNCLSS
mmetsp:Transcript_4248/g.12200  ORF Transcript_4248/g.12200 Transcript_4248/m.12200 type:complete len:279 (-) Transcript_4248:19-855(-)